MQPAAYLKILALLVPREHKVEHRNPLKELTDEELEAMIEHLKASTEAQEQRAKLIEGRRSLACRRQLAPKILEAVRRHLGVPDRMLDVPVAEVVLQSPCVVAIIGELKAAGMAQHVGVDREWHLGSLADALDETVEANRTDWPAALGNEHVGIF